MNHLIAKVNGDKSKPCYNKIISNKKIYDLPNNLSSFVDYSPDHLLDEDSWYRIEKFSDKEYCIPLLKENFNSTKFDMLNKINVNKIEFMCSYQNNQEYYFQRVFKSNFVNKKILNFGEKCKFEEDTKLIVVNEVADAIYLKNIDTLYFKNLTNIVPIFKGIEELYIEATEEETKEFLGNKFIKLEDGFSEKSVKKSNRKRISLAINTLSKFTEDEKKTVFEYTKKYCPDLKFNKKAFIIKSEEDLKRLLYGIEQRYYTTPVKSEKRIANSIIHIG